MKDGTLLSQGKAIDVRRGRCRCKQSMTSSYGCCRCEGSWPLQTQMLLPTVVSKQAMAAVAPVNSRSVPCGRSYPSKFRVFFVSYTHLSHEQQHSKRAVHPSSNGQRSVPPDPYRCHVTRVVSPPPSFPANRANLSTNSTPWFPSSVVYVSFRHEIVFVTDALCICDASSWTCEPANEHVHRRKEEPRRHVDVARRRTCRFVAVEREMRRQKMED